MAVLNINGEAAETAHQAENAHLGPPSLKGPRSAPDHKRRNSLPQHFLPPNLWSANTSRASLVESEEAARGENILDRATVAHRISALRQINGGTRSRHRYAKSTGASNSTFSQPVIVRTYSGTRPQSRQREAPVKPAAANNMGKVELPPVEAFSFKGIMDSIQNSVADDLERIAEICARSRYSLSNQYEVHMPPHGEGEPFLQTPSHVARNGANGPTLQAIASDDDQMRTVNRPRGGRRTKSMAYGTLETIMSSSKSSEEEKTKKKAAGRIAEEVRGRAALKASAREAQNIAHEASNAVNVDNSPPTNRAPSRSATFASMVMDTAHGMKADAPTHLISPSYLASEPARPKTSIGLEQDPLSAENGKGLASSSVHPLMSPQPTLTRHESRASTLLPDTGPRPSILESLSSWLPWGRQPGPGIGNAASRTRSVSHAEGSLRDLLKSTESDRKGKGVERLP